MSFSKTNRAFNLNFFRESRKIIEKEHVQLVKVQNFDGKCQIVLASFLDNEKQGKACEKIFFSSDACIKINLIK